MSTVTLKGAPVQISSSLPALGSKAPNFIATKNDLTDVELKNYLGKKIVLNIFPSLDTQVCAIAMKKFNELANELKAVSIWCISADLPFAQKRFCAAEHLENVLAVSIFRHPEFGEKYGVTLMQGPLKGLLSRAVVIIDEQGKVVYTEQVAEISDEPDYTAMLSAIKA